MKNYCYVIFKIENVPAGNKDISYTEKTYAGSGKAS